MCGRYFGDLESDAVPPAVVPSPPFSVPCRRARRQRAQGPPVCSILPSLPCSLPPLRLPVWRTCPSPYLRPQTTFSCCGRRACSVHVLPKNLLHGAVIADVCLMLLTRGARPDCPRAGAARPASTGRGAAPPLPPQPRVSPCLPLLPPTHTRHPCGNSQTPRFPPKLPPSPGAPAAGCAVWGPGARARSETP